jgi:hypothetical protein
MLQKIFQRKVFFLQSSSSVRKSNDNYFIQLQLFFSLSLLGRLQGCQMVYFQTKISNLGKFWKVLQRKMLLHFMAIWSILRPYGIFCCHLVYLKVIWYIFSRFWYVVPKKSGNPAPSLGVPFWSFVRYLHNPIDYSENCVVRHLVMPYDKAHK